MTRFLTGSDAPVSVIATDLYQEIPPSTDPVAQEQIGRGRKLLTFSDSRQDAAFFAPYLENTYRRAVERRLIAGAVEAERDTEPRIEDLVRRSSAPPSGRSSSTRTRAEPANETRSRPG